MIILGINDGHDSGVCLFRDGRIILCSSEERRLNAKNYAGVPTQSIAAVFRRSGIDPREVDLVALSSRIRTTVPTPAINRSTMVLNLLSSLATNGVGNIARSMAAVEATQTSGIVGVPGRLRAVPEAAGAFRSSSLPCRDRLLSSPVGWPCHRPDARRGRGRPLRHRERGPGQRPGGDRAALPSFTAPRRGCIRRSRPISAFVPTSTSTRSWAWRLTASPSMLPTCCGKLSRFPACSSAIGRATLPRGCSVICTGGWPASVSTTSRRRASKSSRN